jgi:hypothetical protein
MQNHTTLVATFKFVLRQKQNAGGFPLHNRERFSLFLSIFTYESIAAGRRISIVTSVRMENVGVQNSFR